MSILDAYYLQKATLWTKGAPSGFGGFSYNAPVVINVRWEDRSELATDPEGNQFVSKARVYLSQDVGVDDYLYLGESAGLDPKVIEGAHRIRDFRKIPDLFNENHEKKVLL